MPDLTPEPTVTYLRRGSQPDLSIPNASPIENLVHELMGEAELDATVFDAQSTPQDWKPASPLVLIEARKQGPPSGHRNAILCPQCDLSTWKGSEQCWNCGFRLLDYYEEVAANEFAERKLRIEGRIRREREKRMKIAGMMALAAFASMILSSYSPAWFQMPLLFGGMGLLCVASVIVKLHQ